ncbi:tetratricopeptide repeat protein [endosymbiont of unidentified scaly snail isolate Monju]|uniref:tetratricopeptide repeat protein n=1 Tax=endosymbiont of unidentified scaly snail isolate Monju TaxID=1248727 RepID=UPI000A620AB9|nr:tetratricopeptide repeat protein [endosymbiont of unidentified scaly snail isolate Monju]
MKSRFSREAESEADVYGMRYMVRAGYDPAAAVSLQETFVRLFEDKSPGWLAGLFASHPPSRERVAANRRLLAELGNPGGERGRERYQRAIAHLRQVQPAYEAYAQARKALDAGDMQRALGLVDKAMRIEPKEALFPTLRGEIHKRRGRRREALRDFDRALALNPDYYLPRVQRSLLERELGRQTAAERDLEASIALLPTAEAYYGLGLIAEQRGRTREALGYFQAVATSESEMSKDAARRLALLDLADHPDSYLKASLGLRKDGRLLLRLRNASAVPVRGIRVVIGRPVGRRFEPLRTLRLRGRLPAGREQRLDTGLQLRDAAEARGLVARVIAARPVR